MSGDRRKYVMSVEVAMQREMAYRKRLELSLLKQDTESRKHPIPQNQTSLPSSHTDPKPSTEVGASTTLSLWSKPSPNPSSTSTQKPSPSSRPSPGPRSTLQPRLKSVLGPSPIQPRGPSLTLKRISPSKGRTAGPRLLARPSLSSGSDPVGRRLEPILHSLPKPAPAFPSPRPHTAPRASSALSPKLPLLGPSAGLKQSVKPSLLSRPCQGPPLDPILGPGPSHKRKEVPEQLQHHHTAGNKISKLVCNVCEVICSSPANLQMHLHGQNHRAKVQNKGLTSKGKESEKIGAIDPRLRCELYEVWCMNEFSLQQHLNGKNHICKLHAFSRRNENPSHTLY